MKQWCSNGITNGKGGWCTDMVRVIPMGWVEYGILQLRVVRGEWMCIILNKQCLSQQSMIGAQTCTSQRLETLKPKQSKIVDM